MQAGSGASLSFVSMEERLRASRFNIFGSKTSKPKKKAIPSRVQAEEADDERFSATAEEAEGALEDDTRMTDWIFWKMGARCLLSKSFKNKVVAFRLKQVTKILETNIRTLKDEIEATEKSLADAEMNLGFVSDEATHFLRQPKKYQRENRAKEARIRRKFNEYTYERRILTEKLERTYTDYRAARVALESYRRPVELQADGFKQILEDLRDMDISRVKNVGELRDMLTEHVENTVTEKDGLLSREKVDYIYNRRDALDMDASDLNPYNEMKSELDAELEAEGQATGEEEEEAVQEPDAEPRPAIPAS